MPPRILHLSTYDANGGAARAAYALHRAMVAEGLDSTMRVAVKTVDDPTVQGPPPGRFGKFARAQFADRQLWKLQKSPRKTWRSPARFTTITADEINRSPYDVINLHWVTDGFLSIKEIGKIEKPIVWSLYDMWPFAGTEHYGADEPNARWRWGYTKANRPTDESGFDLDKSTWELKSKLWTKPITIVPASSWLEQSVKSSALMRHWPITRIPHVVDCDVFAPMDMNEARTKLALPLGVPLILFLASAGIHDRRKGWDLLDEALVDVRKSVPEVEVVVVGPPSTSYESKSGVKIHWRGSVSGDEALRLHYCATDVTAVPSREDNMPLTAMEAQSCGRSVCAFDLGGLPNIVTHGVTGYLASVDDTDDLAVGLLDTLGRSREMNAWGIEARARALRTWSPNAVVKDYSKVYGEHDLANRQHERRVDSAPVLVLLNYRGGARLKRALDSLRTTESYFSRVVLSMATAADSEDMEIANDYLASMNAHGTPSKAEVICPDQELPTMEHQRFWINYLAGTGTQDDAWIFWLAYDDEVRLSGLQEIVDDNGIWPLRAGVAYLGPWAMRHEQPAELWQGDPDSELESWTAFPTTGMGELPVASWIATQIQQPTYIQMSGSVISFGSHRELITRKPVKLGPMRIEMATAAMSGNVTVAEFPTPLTCIYGRPNSDRANYAKTARREDIHLARTLLKRGLRQPRMLPSILKIGWVFVSQQTALRLGVRALPQEEWRVRGRVSP